MPAPSYKRIPCLWLRVPAGLQVNPDRPHDKLPYRGAWLWIGPEMIHLMELPNPDPTDKSQRPGCDTTAVCVRRA
jgi:glyoxylase I family protein